MPILVDTIEHFTTCSVVVYILSMSDEHDNTNEKFWDQQEGESSLWYGRFRAYLLLGVRRSVNAVFHLEAEESRDYPRTEIQGHWYEYAKKYKWEERAQSYDKHWIEEQDIVIAAERAKVIRTGYALQHKRIEILDKLVSKLVEMTEDDDKVWLTESKTVWNGRNPERVEAISLNHPLFTLIDKYQASIAAEMGERVKKQEIGVTNNDIQDTKKIHEAIEQSLEEYPELKIALAERLAEIERSI